MSKKPVLQIDLGEIDPYFERFAIAHGWDVVEALGVVFDLFVKSEIQLPTGQGRKRKVRYVPIKTAEDKALVDAVAGDQKLRPGRAIRLAALKYMMTSMSDDASSKTVGRWYVPGGFSPDIANLDNSSVRLELSPTKSEMDALTVKSEEGGYRSVQDLIIWVMRSFFTNAPVLDPKTVAEMGKTNLSLVRIGTNLNQLAKVLNNGGMLGGDDAGKLMQTLALVDQHTKEVAAALVLARSRWVLINAAY